MKTIEGFIVNEFTCGSQKRSGQVFTHTYKHKTKNFLNSRKTQVPKGAESCPPYLSGWTLEAIQRSCHNIKCCGTFEKVKVKQVGSVSDKKGR